MKARDLIADADDEIERMARNFRAEALGEMQWLERVYGAGPILSGSLAANALRRAAMYLEQKR